MIPDTQARTALRQAQLCARRQWQADGYCCDLSEYEDATMDALAGCLARFDPQRGIAFSTYAARRMAGAAQDAAERYRTWRQGRWWREHKPRVELLRPGDSPQQDPVFRSWVRQAGVRLRPEEQGLLAGLLAGETLPEIAEHEGIAYITVYMRYRALLRTLKRVMRRDESLP